MPSIFLSHSSRDKAFARKLASRLQDMGLRIWIDEAEINVGDSLLTKISSAIEETDFVAVVLSHNSVKSSWVQTELRMAMTKELAEQRVRVLPILIEPCDIPMFLQDKLYADFSDPDSFDAPFAQVLRAVGVEKSMAQITAAPSTPDVPVAKAAARVHTETTDRPDAREVTPPDSQTFGLQDFVDIEIIGVDKDRTYNPDPEKFLFNVYFRLSAYPPAEWAEIFAAERRFPRHTMWRRAWVDGKYIVVHCVPDEVKRFHLRDIKEDVDSANRNYRDSLHQQEQRRINQVKKEEVQGRALDEALDNLDV